MAFTGVIGSADSQLGNILLGSAGGADNNYAAAGASTSSGSVVFTIVSLNFTATGTGTSSGSVVFKAIRVSTFAGGSVSSGSIVFVAIYDFTTLTEVLASMSASIREASPDTPDPESTYLRLDGTASVVVRSLIGIDRRVPIGVGAQVLRANLVLYKGAAWTDSGTVTAQPLDGAWEAASVTWNTQPAVRAETASASVSTGGADGDEVSIDITELIQASIAEDDAAGVRWYGLRLVTDATGEQLFHSAHSSPSLRPRMEIEWSIPPAAPLDLLPNGGRAISETKPEFVFRFFDEDAEDTLSAIQVQIDTEDTFETPDYDSGQLSHSLPRFDLNAPPTGAPATPTLLAATTYYWRAKVWDNHGQESDWSEGASFVYVAKGTLTLDSPATSSVSSPTPTISWTASAQTSYEVEVERRVGSVWEEHWTVARTVGATTEVTLPDAYRLQENEDYRVTVRVWDATDREDLSGDRAFLEDSQEITLDPVSI